MDLGVFLECSVRYRPDTMDALRACRQTRNIRVNEGVPV